MADDLVVREWNWGFQNSPISWADEMAEHNALARAYLERDAQLAAMTAERDTLVACWAELNQHHQEALGKLKASEAARGRLDAAFAKLKETDPHGYLHVRRVELPLLPIEDEPEKTGEP